MRPAWDERLPAWRVERFDHLPSTQSFIKDRLRRGHDVHGLVVRTTEQGAGLGRGGKSWSSPPGGSYQSLALQDRWGGALRRPGLTLLLAVELAEELRAGGAHASVKWPNDVYLGEGKLAGVLSEYVRGHLVVGIGVNVSDPVQSAASSLGGWDVQFVNELVLRAAGAALLSAVERSVQAAGADAVDHMGSAALPGLARRLKPLDYLAGRRVNVSTPGGAVLGVAAGVNDDGALLVGVTGQTITVTGGSVTDWS